MNKRGTGIALSYINTITNMICGIFLSAYILRVIGDTEYGVYQTISSFANYLVLLEFGTGTAMTRNLSVCRAKQSNEEEIDKNVGTIWLITVVLSAIILLVSIIFYISIDGIYSKSMTVEQILYAKRIFVFVTVYLLASFFVQTLNGVVLAHEQYTFSSGINLFRTITRTMLLVGLLLMWRRSIIIAIVDMFLTVVILVVTYLFCVKKLKIRIAITKFDKKVFLSTYSLCFAVFLQVIINQSNNNVDKFIIGIKMNPEAVTLYSVGMYIYSVFSSLTTIPISMYAPEVAKNVTRGLCGEELEDTLIKPSRLITLIGGTVLFGFIAVGKQFITIMYGRDYLISWWIAVLIMIPMFVNMSNGILINVLDVMNKRMSRSIILLVTTILNIVLTVFFLEWYGIVGAALATMIATFLGQIIIMNLYYYNEIKINVIRMFRLTYKGILIYQIAASVISYLIANLINNSYVSFFIGGIVYCLVFILGFWYWGANQEEKFLVMK